jgi:hypothetical protein
VMREVKSYSKFVARALLPAAPTLMSAPVPDQIILISQVIYYFVDIAF